LKFYSRKLAFIFASYGLSHKKGKEIIQSHSRLSDWRGIEQATADSNLEFHLTADT
jgi:hypothetical protein